MSPGLNERGSARTRPSGRDAQARGSQESFLLGNFIVQSTLPKNSLAMQSILTVAALVGALSAAPAFAARDLPQLQEQQRANQAAIARRASEALVDSTSTRNVLPLDHGPRATTTPWLNEQRRLHEQSPASVDGSTQH